LFGNAPNGIAYRMSGRDAVEIEENYRDPGAASQIVNLNNYQFVAYFIRNGIPLDSGVIDAKAKVKKTGTEAPSRAVIAESVRRWGAPRVKTDSAILPSSQASALIIVIG
jgi:hypothetical protein